MEESEKHWIRIAIDHQKAENIRDSDISYYETQARHQAYTHLEERLRKLEKWLEEAEEQAKRFLKEAPDVEPS